jgi:hypothetical protein
MLAAMNDHAAVVDMLIEHGADANVVNDVSTLPAECMHSVPDSLAT